MSQDELEANGVYRIDPDGVRTLSDNQVPKPLQELMTDRWVSPDGYVYYMPDYPVSVDTSVTVHRQ